MRNEVGTLTEYNYRTLRAAGIPSERAFPAAERWATQDQQAVGYTYCDGQLLIQLQRTSPPDAVITNYNFDL